MATTKSSAVPPTMVEFLRFCIVVFMAGLGSNLAELFGASSQVVVGAFDGRAIGVILGAAVGYVIGGVVARLTFRSLAQTEQVLAGRSAEQLLAGLTGAIAGLLTAAALTWPILMLGQEQYTIPLFLFVLATIASLGYRLALSRRDAVLAMLGGSGRLEVLRPHASALPKVVDTSAAIDARVVDVVRAGFLHGHMLVPEPVLAELQGFADSPDDARRAKGRRGIETLEILRSERGVDLEVISDEAPEAEEVDAKLVQICRNRRAALLTLDTNLARVAELGGVRVLNLHALALALRPPVLAGEQLTVLLTRRGKEPGQGVGYLDDGTMVVVEHSSDHIGQEMRVTVVSVLVTANGRMVFAKPTAQDVPRQREANVSEVTARIAAAAVAARKSHDRSGPDGDRAGSGASSGSGPGSGSAASRGERAEADVSGAH